MEEETGSDGLIGVFSFSVRKMGWNQITGNCSATFPTNYNLAGYVMFCEFTSILAKKSRQYACPTD